MVVLASRPADRYSRTDLRVLKSAIDRRLGSLLPPVERRGDLGEAMRYSLLAPGKRIRPILTVLAGWEVGPRDLQALDAGCALEMVHAASLVLDDMPAMDDARERRGQPATHVKFGEDVAMLCAITLLSQSFATLAAMREIDAATRSSLVAILAQAVGVDGLAGGQYRDLRPVPTGGPALVEDANRKKTGALFVAAAEMAVALHRLDGDAAGPLRRCADELGQAYQLLDDLLDSGKAGEAGHCEDVGKVTLLTLLGQDETKRKLRGHVEGALDGLQPDGSLAGYVRSLFVGDHVRAELVP